MSTAVRRAIYGKLAGDSTLIGLLASPPSGRSKSLYHQVAPNTAAYPYVIFLKNSGTPRYSLGSRAMDNELWLVKAVDEQPAITASADTADAIAARIDYLLTDGAISISGAKELYLRRESDVEYPEVSGDQRFFHAGALYRLMYQ